MKMRKGIDDDHLTYLDAGRIAAGGRGRRRSPCTAAPPRSTTPARPTGTRSPRSSSALGHPGARQRRHLGGRRRAADDARRPAATASWSGAAASAGRGCSPTWPPRSTAGREPRAARRSARSRRSCAGTPSCWCVARRRARRGCTRLPQARRLVPQGLPGRLRAAPARWPWSTPGRAGRPARQARPGRAVPGRRALGQPRGRTNSPGKVVLPDGWLDDPRRRHRSRRAPSWTTPAADSPGSRERPDPGGGRPVRCSGSGAVAAAGDPVGELVHVDPVGAVSGLAESAIVTTFPPSR